VGVAADVEQAIAQLVGEFGGLDLIGHSAGVSWPGKDVIDLTERDWDMLVDTNAKSCYLLAHYGIPHIRARGGGAVVNISSAIATTTAATASGYSAAKASVDTFTRAVAIETAKYGIRFNAVAPGIVLTPMVEADAERSDLEPQEYLETLEKIAPLGRLITAEEVASLALYLLSDEASAITGSVHKVDGGWTAQINLGEVF
jgi:NAD(P)-dependent dehydrogenase (short-subunit alcohol dehydrogenase family)